MRGGGVGGSRSGQLGRVGQKSRTAKITSAASVMKASTPATWWIWCPGDGAPLAALLPPGQP